MNQVKSIASYLILFLAAAVPSTVAALQFAEDIISHNYTIGGQIVPLIVAVFLVILFVTVGKAAGEGFANALIGGNIKDVLIFSIPLILYAAGEIWVNPTIQGKVAAVFVTMFYIVVPMARYYNSTAETRREKAIAIENLEIEKLNQEILNLKVEGVANRKAIKLTPIERNTHATPMQHLNEGKGNTHATPMQHPDAPVLSGTRQQVYELYLKNPNMKQSEVAEILGVSRQLVGRHKKALADYLKKEN